MAQQRCVHCGSEKITHDVKVHCDNGDNFPPRAHYRNPKKSVLRPYLDEYFYADMCNECGTVVRLYVRQPHDDWETGEY